MDSTTKEFFNGTFKFNIALSLDKRILNLIKMPSNQPVHSFMIEDNPIGLFLNLANYTITIEEPKRFDKSPNILRLPIRKENGSYTIFPILKINIIDSIGCLEIGSDDQRLGRVVFHKFDGSDDKINIQFRTLYRKEYLEIRY